MIQRVALRQLLKGSEGMFACLDGDLDGMMPDWRERDGMPTNIRLPLPTAAFLPVR